MQNAVSAKKLCSNFFLGGEGMVESRKGYNLGFFIAARFDQNIFWIQT